MPLRVPTAARRCPRVPGTSLCPSSKYVERQGLRAGDGQSPLISRFQVQVLGGAPSPSAAPIASSIASPSAHREGGPRSLAQHQPRHLQRGGRALEQVSHPEVERRTTQQHDSNEHG